MTLQLAIIGAAHIHVPGFIRMLGKRSDVRITHVWDHDATRAARRASELSARVEDYKVILADPVIAGVIICSETDRHEPLVMAAAKARKAMFVEKPLGLNRDDALRMAAAIESGGVIFQTGYFMRSLGINRFLKEQVDRGSFGKITRVRVSNVHEGALAGWFDTEWRWMADAAQAGCGGFGDLGTHVLDLLLWMFGDVRRATATITNGIERYPGCDECGEGLLEFESGIIGTIAAGWDDVAN
ncbi:MAG: Gfo/Idh/MocA family oxidoreductase, partial [Phycisphaerae bacterium]|nr:Gfo/Idh/MocA family oxidoreductase [Phycisphaerae bacterium]